MCGIAKGLYFEIQEYFGLFSVFADQLSRSISLYFSHMQYRDLYIVVKLWLNKHGPTWEGFFQALTMVQKEKIISI